MTSSSRQSVSPAPSCLRQASRLPGPVRGRQKVERLVAGRVEPDPALVDEEHAVAALERQRGPLLREEDRRAELAGEVEELFGALRIELRGRLVEQEQRGLEGEHRGEAHSLELPGGQRLGSALGQPLAPNLGERGVHARPDLTRRRADVLEAEGDLVRDRPEDDLVLGILEERRNLACEVGRAEPPGVPAGDHDAALESPAVEVRNEPCERAEERRLAGTGRAEQRDDLAGLDPQ